MICTIVAQILKERFSLNKELEMAVLVSVFFPST
jgi:hypothetical protein